MHNVQCVMEFGRNRCQERIGLSVQNAINGSMKSAVLLLQHQVPHVIYVHD